jgi:xylan 1,4-beta-xylosidase
MDSTWVKRLLWTGIVAMGSVRGIAQQARLPVNITVDLTKDVGPYRPIYNWFGYDESNYTTTAQGRELLGELHDLSPVPVTIRVHHLLTSGDGVPELKWSSTNVYSEDSKGRPRYDFQILDGIFDSFKAAGVRPMVELGFMPKDLAAVLPDMPGQAYQVHFGKGDVVSGASNNPPKDYAKWGELARVVTAHLVERYGRDDVSRWYFEVWNEPDIMYWHGSRDEYLKLYDYAVAGVRAALPEALVGGPATTSPRSDHAAEYLKAFLEHVDTGKSAADGGRVPLNFISFHAKGQPTFAGGQVKMGIKYELTDVDRGFALVASFPRLAKLPIILSEADPEGCAACSAKTNPANNYRNGTLYPAYTAAAYKRLLELADKYQVNLLGMVSWSFEFEGKDYFEGFRSLATHGVDKPVLNVFRIFGLMTGTRVAATSTGAVPLVAMIGEGVRKADDVGVLATHSVDKAAVMVWDYHDVARGDEGVVAKVQVNGLPSGVKRVLAQEYRIDGTHSNAYTVWLGMGSPQVPTPGQQATLKAAGGLQTTGSPKWLTEEDGSVVITTVMSQESVSLFAFSW